MRREKLAIANIYVPVKRRATLKPDTVREIAQSMLEVGQTTPILVRRDGERFVLVHGLHRLEACMALGEESIFGYIIQAQGLRLGLRQSAVRTNLRTNAGSTSNVRVGEFFRREVRT